MGASADTGGLRACTDQLRPGHRSYSRVFVIVIVIVVIIILVTGLHVHSVTSDYASLIHPANSWAVM